MSLNVKPDPKRPTGGYAQIEGDFDGDEVSVSVFNNFAERYLGEHGWQSVREEFGPYPVDRSGGTARIVVGPEIVNQLEEYANLRFQVGTVVAELNWPDTIAQRPGAAALGGIRTAGSKAPPQPRGNAAASMAAEGRDEAIGTDAAPNEAEGGNAGGFRPLGGGEETGTGEKGRKPLWLIIALIVIALAIVAAVAWYFWSQNGEGAPVAQEQEDTQQPEPAAEPEIVPAAEPVVDDTCSSEALRASSDRPFAEIMSQLAACGAAADPDATMTLIENAALADNPQALLLFGELYDEANTNAVVEEIIGVTFSDNPAQAAEYYARARDAGSSQANIRLVSLCERLGRLSDTLSQAAFGDYCS